MKWLLVKLVVLCLALCGCKTKVKSLDYLQSNQTHWGEVINTNKTLSDEIEEIWVNPSIFFRGDSVAIPPFPPATSFHYVLAPPSEMPSSAHIVPALVRKVRKMSASVDTTAHDDMKTEDIRKEVVNVSRTPIDWGNLVKVLSFVGIICLFVYLFLIVIKKSLTLH